MRMESVLMDFACSAWVTACTALHAVTPGEGETCAQSASADCAVTPTLLDADAGLALPSPLLGALPSEPARGRSP